MMGDQWNYDGKPLKTPALRRSVCASREPDYRKTGSRATVSDMLTFRPCYKLVSQHEALPWLDVLVISGACQFQPRGTDSRPRQATFCLTKNAGRRRPKTESPASACATTA